MTNNVKDKITKLIPSLKKFGLKLTIDNNFIYLAAEAKLFNTGAFEANKRIIYYLLNTFENDYFILLKNIPYCLLPDAVDHIDYKESASDYFLKFNNCKQCRFFSSCPGINRIYAKHIKKVSPVIDLPIDISIEVNKACNLSCQFCTRSLKAQKIYPSFSKIKKVLDDARRLNIKYARFTGGEPLLRKDILKILIYAKSKGFHTFLNTNATLLNTKTIRVLEKCADNVLVSLCGYDNLTEELINSKTGVIKTKLVNVLRLTRSNIPRIRIGTVISDILIDNFTKYAALIKFLGIRNWELYRPILSKESTQQHKIYDINRNKLQKLLKLMHRAKKTGINTYIANSTPFCITDNIEFKTLMRGAQFDDGHNRLVFDNRGFFKPSYFIEENLGTNLEEAWNKVLRKNIASCKSLSLKCKHCKYLSWCLGGSRSLANTDDNNHSLRDPLMSA